MRYSRRLIPLILVLALASLPAIQGCGPNKIREARKAAYRIQVITDAAVDTAATLYHDGVISKERTNQIAKVLLKVNEGNRILIEKAGSATVDSPALRSDLLAQVRLIADAVKELKAQGLLGIKSKNGELAFASAINALDSALAIIEVALRSK